MGIYLFKRDVLVEVLEKTNYQDFGKEVFPASIRARHVQVHLFDGYWEDIGTSKSFYEANLQLAHHKPPFDLADGRQPIYTRPRFLPPTRIDGATIRQSLIADGCLIEPGAIIENSVIGLRCRVGRGATIKNSVVMGADQYEPSEEAKDGRPAVGIGDGATIDGAIVDKNCRIGRNVCIAAQVDQPDRDLDSACFVRDGIVVVEKDGILPDGWTIGS
jgi:glucose-1-phosphate adenylyltransferase